jgi:LPPG:FO 2-phospho-L-lactate transferase
MMQSLGQRADAVGVAQRYAGLAGTLVIDHADEALGPEIAALGLTPVCRDILMPDADAKARLAGELRALVPQQQGCPA